MGKLSQLNSLIDGSVIAPDDSFEGLQRLRLSGIMIWLK